MTYQEQLSEPEWIKKRLKILERDNNKCTECNKERSQFRGLSKSFGILSFEEFKAKGYELIKSTDHIVGYSNLRYMDEDWGLSVITYIGSTDREFNLTELKFAKKCDTQNTPFGLKNGCWLIAFYDEAIIGKSLVDLNVHHIYYIQGRLAWEYEDGALISLCVECHKKVHDENEIYVVNEKGDKLFITEVCGKCGGSGYLEEYHYFKHGVCFQCWGEGVINIEETSSI